MVPRKLVEHAIMSLPLLVLPIVLAPLLVLALRPAVPDQYESEATVWASNSNNVELATSLDTNTGRAAPAGRLASVLTDLLRTRTFRESVAISAGLLDPETATEATIGQAATTIGQSTNVRPRGTYLVAVSVTSTNPRVAQAIAAGVIVEYQKRDDLEIARQSEIAGEAFRRRLEIARADLTVRQDALVAFVTAHPEVEFAQTGVNVEERESLRRSVTAQEAVVTELELALQRVSLDAATSSLGQDARFLVQDMPRIPETPRPVSLTQTFGFPLVAAAFGVMISASYVFVRFRMDYTLRSEEDFAGMSAQFLGAVPNLGSNNHLPWYRRIRRSERGFARRVARSLILDVDSDQPGA